MEEDQVLQKLYVCSLIRFSKLLGLANAHTPFNFLLQLKTKCATNSLVWPWSNDILQSKLVLLSMTISWHNKSELAPAMSQHLLHWQSYSFSFCPPWCNNRYLFDKNYSTPNWVVGAVYLARTNENLLKAFSKLSKRTNGRSSDKKRWITAQLFSRMSKPLD